MSRCYHCEKKGIEGETLKQSFGIEIERETESIAKGLFILGEFWINRDKQHIPFGLCKECMALAFKEGARALEQMSEDDFKLIL